MKCIKCNSDVADGMQFCPYCGNPMSQKCEKCGAELEEGATFCSNCGNRIEQVSQPQQPNQGQYQQPNQGQYQQPNQGQYQQPNQGQYQQPNQGQYQQPNQGQYQQPNQGQYQQPNQGQYQQQYQQPNQGQYQQSYQGQYQQPYRQQKPQLPHLPQLTFAEAINLASHRLTEYTGRSRRSEFWWWYLLVVIGSVVVGFIPFIGNLVYIAQFLLLFSIIMRRFNDCSTPQEFSIIYLVIYGIGCVFNTLCDFAEPGSKLYYSLIDILGDSFQTYGVLFIIVAIIGLFYLVKDSNPEVDPIHGPSPKYTM